jgi:hypothetical protein
MEIMVGVGSNLRPWMADPEDDGPVPKNEARFISQMCIYTVTQFSASDCVGLHEDCIGMHRRLCWTAYSSLASDRIVPQGNFSSYVDPDLCSFIDFFCNG